MSSFGSTRLWAPIRRRVRRWTADRVVVACVVLAVISVVLSSARIVATYDQLSQTVDEPNHIATGLEWWERGSYCLHAENPPLSRIAIALPLYLTGTELAGHRNAWQGGTAILYDGDYRHNLSLARLGVLPFFWLTAWVVWAWTRRLSGAPAAAVAVGALVTLPALVGNAGLATTDVPLVGTLSLAVYWFVRWIEQPSWRRSLLLGVGFGLALATKYSALLFFPVAALAIAAAGLLGGKRDLGRDQPASGWRRRLTGGGVALLAAFLLVWAVFGFSVGATVDEPGAVNRLESCAPSPGVKRSLVEAVASTSMPAPELFHGLVWLCAHNEHGHAAYLLGDVSQRGFWHFYPVAIAVKTPLPFLLLALAGLGWIVTAAIRRRASVGLAPALAALAILLVALPGNIQLGLRHLLILYPLLAVVVGIAAVQLWNWAYLRRLWRGGLVVLATIQLVGFVLVHPNYLAYFNAYAGDEPGEILVGTDLDWGQDLLQLEAFFRDRDVDHFHLAYFGSAGPCHHQLPPFTWLAPGQPVTGWIAISEMYYRGLYQVVFREPCDMRTAYRPRGYGREGYRWLEMHEPAARVGGSIRVYYIPPHEQGDDN